MILIAIVSKALQRPGLYGFDAGKEAVAVPAHAGTAGLYAPMSAADRDHPRLRGDHYNQKEIYCEGEGSSPHVRGPRSRRTTPQPCPGIIPACAGTTGPACTRATPGGDHPRMCGDHRLRMGQGRDGRGSSPHVRGPRLDELVAGHAGGIIPTRVGTFRRARPRDHPHTRGDHPVSQSLARVSPGSSPHAWGPLLADGVLVDLVRIIPTRVGTT